MSSNNSNIANESTNEEQSKIQFEIDSIIFKRGQKIALILIYLVTTGLILIILDFTKSFQVPKLSGFEQLDFSAEVDSFLTFFQLFFLVVLLPFTIFDIVKGDYIPKIKRQIPILFIFAAGIIILLFLFLLVQVSTNNDKIIYLGISPEILIAGIVFSFILYFSPSHYLLKYYNM